jgi:Right handed beta helix region
MSARSFTTIAATWAVAGWIHGAQLHVAPNGNDGNPGTADRPFATLVRARDAARAARAKGENVSLILDGGIYRLEQTLDFNAADSGTAEAPVIWKAAPGEKVRIVGGLVVPPDAIQRVTDPAILHRVISVKARSHLLEIDLSALGIKDYGQVGPRGFRRPYLPAPLELFIGDKPMPLASWPNPGEPLIPIGKILDTGSIPRNGEKPLRGGKFVVNTDRPKLWSNVNDIWISGLFHYGYADDTVCLAAITETTNGLVFTTVQPHMYGFKSGSPWNAWYAMNVLAEIDLPGEYAVDRRAGKLYFLPPKNVDVRKTEVMVSTLGAPLVALEGTSYIRFEHLVFEVSRGMGVYIERGEACVLSSCVFRNLGMLGVCIGRGIAPDPLYRLAFTGRPVSRQIGSLDEHFYDHPDFNRQAGRNQLVENCSFYDLGAGGISLGGGDRKTLTPAHNTVFNCDIHDFNRWDRSYRAGVNIDGVGNRIQHCLIYNAPGSAIYLHGNDHLIENNEIHHVMQEGNDMGAFYMGRDPTEFGNVIRDNYFHDIGFGRTRSTWTIYYDDGACGSEACGNIFVHAGRGGTFLIGGGKYNFTRDNIFVDCGLAIHIDNRLQGWGKGMIAKDGIFARRLNLMNIEQPPFSVRYPQLAKYWQDNPAMPADPVERNLFVRCQNITNAKPEWGPFKDNWETKNDPGFVDMAKGDFRLKLDAEVFKKIPGFKPGDFSQMGLLKLPAGDSQ